MADGVNYSLKGFDQYKVLLGDELRGERATLGKSLLDVQRDLKIKASYIAAIENCDLDVFSNKGFVAGYVRSYARYLNLDGEAIYLRFCQESGFSTGNTNFSLQLKKPENELQKQYGQGSNWTPGKIGQVDYKRREILNSFSSVAPVLLVLFVLFGTVWGGMSVLKQVQKLDIVALEQAPQVVTDQVTIVSNSSVLRLHGDIYSSEELSLPVFEPRDRALSSLRPDTFTALENNFGVPIMTYSKLSQSDKKIERSDLSLINVNIGLPDPVVRTEPYVPNVKLIAMTPAWVRIKNKDGNVVFEKTLKERETFLIKRELFNGQLRSGNAQNVYFVIDDEVLGPLSEHKSVVKKVSLDPKIIRINYVISAIATDIYRDNKFDHVNLNTAEVLE